MSRSGWLVAAARCGFLAVAAAMLLTPLLGGFLAGSAPQTDNRALAPAPTPPTGYEALVAWPRQMDAYLGDHFGLRASLVRASDFIKWNLLNTSPTQQIVIGRSGRIFLSDGDVPYRVLQGNCGAWWSDGDVEQFASGVGDALRRLRRAVPHMPLLIVPTAGVLYPQDLPGWMARACRGRTPLAEQILERLPQELRADVYYPLAAAKALPESAPLIPRHNFHWDGQGVQLFMERFAESTWGIRRQVAPNMVEVDKPADLSVFVPGAELSNRLLVSYWPPPGVDYCLRPDCIDQPPLDGLVLSTDIERWRRTGTGGKLLLLADSFGAGAGSALIEYFDDIIFISMNDFLLLSPEQRAAVWHRVTAEWRPDRILMLIQDGNTTALTRFAQLVPDGPER